MAFNPPQGLTNIIRGFFQGEFSGTSNTLRYGAIGGNLTQLTENDVGIIHDYPIVIKRVRYISSGNTKNAVCNIALRDDNADITGTTKTFNAGVSESFDSGALNYLIEAGSKVNWKVDNSASTSGTIIIIMYAAYEVALL
jgi:hypothetical protein